MFLSCCVGHPQPLMSSVLLELIALNTSVSVSFVVVVVVVIVIVVVWLLISTCGTSHVEAKWHITSLQFVVQALL